MFGYRLTNLALIFFLTTLHSSLVYSSTQSHPFVVSGVIINSDNAKLINRFVDYLSTRSGYPLKVKYVKKYTELSHTLRDHPDAIGWTCGAPFVQDSQSMGQQLIAVPLFNRQPTYHSIVLTQKNRQETSLVDFKGSVFAYSDSRSNSGFLAPKFALHKANMNINTHFRLLIDTGSHEGSIEALLNGLADVAAVDEYVWQAYYRLHPEAKKMLKAVEVMGPFPFTPIVAGKNVKPEKIRKLSSILSDMNNDEQGKAILSEFYLDGFVVKKPDFYQPIKDMLSEVELETGD